MKKTSGGALTLLAAPTVALAFHSAEVRASLAAEAGVSPGGYFYGQFYLFF